MTRNCELCDAELERPFPEHANYIRTEQETETRTRTKFIGLKHTGKTKKRLNKMDRLLPNQDRQGIAAQMAHPDAPEEREVPAGTKKQGNTITADRRAMPFSVDIEDYEHVEVDSPNAVHRDDIALVLEEEAEVEEPRNLLVCSECTEESDEIIWGVDE